MSIASLPGDTAMRLRQIDASPSRAQLDRIEQLILVVPTGTGAKKIAQLPAGDDLNALLRRSRDRRALPAAATRLQNQRRTAVSIAFLKPSASVFERLSQARLLITDALRNNPASIAVMAPGFTEEQQTILADSFAAAAQMACFLLPAQKKKPVPPLRLRELLLAGFASRIDTRRSAAEAAGTNLARWLSSLPPNELNPTSYREKAWKLAEQQGWEFEFLGEKELLALGAGALLAVARASETRDAGIIHLSYCPDEASGEPDICLVGKGVCFDTGGVNLKQARWMQNMHEDMQGSAVALGTLLAATKIGLPRRIDCWLAVVENDIGPRAYRPQEVIEAANGTTIEVIHSDAEGRMALADTLAIAARAKPAVIIDLATLTGTCVSALTTRYSGAFCNRIEWNARLIQAGRDSGERVWPFPLDEDFGSGLESDIADVRQCTIEGDGDHILAARFLSRFVPEDIPWLHLDLSASRHEGGLGHVPTAITGFGVRFLCCLLIEHGLAEAP